MQNILLFHNRYFYSDKFYFEELKITLSCFHFPVASNG